MNQTEFNNLEQITKITLQHYNNATAFDPNWYKVNEFRVLKSQVINAHFNFRPGTNSAQCITTL